MEKETLSTSNFSHCLIKLLLFTSVILIELICGYSVTDLTPFYLAALVQGINNIYEASAFIDETKYSFFLLIRQSFVICCSAIAIIISICYMCAAPSFIEWLSSITVVTITAALIGSITVVLFYECLAHLVVIYNFDHHSKQQGGGPQDNFKKSLYYECEPDEADSWADIVEQNIGE